MRTITASLVFMTFFTGVALAGDIRTAGEFAAGATALNDALKSYLELSTTTEGGVFRLITESSPKSAARNEVLLAGFFKYLSEEQAVLETIKKDAVGIVNLSENTEAGPEPLLAEMGRVQKYLRLKLFAKRRKLEALDEALEMPVGRFSDMARLGCLFYSGHPTPDSAADVYAGVQASRDFLYNYLRTLERSAPLADLAAAGKAMAAPRAGQEGKKSGPAKADHKWALLGEDTVSPDDALIPMGGERP